MRPLLVLAFLAASCPSLALAQTAGNGAQSAPANSNVAAGTTNNTGVGAAPVGHRQPRVDQVPSENNLSNPDDPIGREDAALDRKIKGICRGC